MICRIIRNCGGGATGHLPEGLRRPAGYSGILVGVVCVSGDLPAAFRKGSTMAIALQYHTWT